jgi:hypothetical protein
VSRLPQLEAQLVAAAAAQQRRRRAPAPWRGRVAALAAAAACAAAVLLLAATRQEAPRPAAGGVRPVPAETIERSHALAASAPPAHDPVSHAQLPAVAAELQARTPYPPGMHDDFDWSATPADPRSPTSINFLPETQRLVEYRSYCLWLRYWVSAQGDIEAVNGADAVLADVPQWPTQRGDSRAGTVVAAAARGDVATVVGELQLNCRGVS